MPTSDDLCGLGMAPSLSAALGNQPKTVTCAGTTLGAATAVLTHNSELVAAGGATGAGLQTSAKIGTPYFFFTSSSTSAVVYVPSGHFLNGSQNGTLTIAQNKGAIVWQYKASNWVSVLTA